MEEENCRQKSLPSRERGLKSVVKDTFEDNELKSLPSRERGLKYPVAVVPNVVANGRSLRGSVD